jgi:hypothetical protein
MIDPLTSRRVSRGGLAAALLACLLVAGNAAAGENEFDISKYGARLGFSSNPDQFTLGAYAQLGELAPHLSMRPSVDLGFGDSVFSLILNADLQYAFVVGSALAPFVGAGLGVAYYSFDVPSDYVGDDSETDVGLNVYGGAEMDLGDYKSGYLEARIGIDEMPDFKLTLGFGFY